MYANGSRRSAYAARVAEGDAVAEAGEPPADHLLGKVVGVASEEEKEEDPSDEDIRRTVVRADSLVRTVVKELNETDVDETEETDSFGGRGGGTTDEGKDKDMMELDNIVRNVVMELDKTDDEESITIRTETDGEETDSDSFGARGHLRGRTADAGEGMRFSQTYSEDTDRDSRYSDEGADEIDKGQEEEIEIPLTPSLENMFTTSKSRDDVTDEDKDGTADDEGDDMELNNIVRNVAMELDKTDGDETEGSECETADDGEDTRVNKTDGEETDCDSFGGRGETADEGEDMRKKGDEAADEGEDSLDGMSPREIRGGGMSRSSSSSRAPSTPKIQIPLVELALPGLFSPGRDVTSETPQQDVQVETVKTDGGDDPLHDDYNGTPDGDPEAPPPHDGEDGPHHHIEEEEEEEEPPTEEDIIRQKLSLRAYHLPGNNWCQDLDMYIRNNHLIIGLFCHHKLHPVKWYHRLVLLLGSFAFGLIITNIVYLHGEAIENTIEQALLEENSVAELGERIYNATDRFVVDEFSIAGHTFEVNTTKLGFLFTIGE